MDIRQLRTFSCVAELGSLSKASDTLRVAQPALSRQIKLLEHELRAEQDGDVRQAEALPVGGDDDDDSTDKSITTRTVEIAAEPTATEAAGTPTAERLLGRATTDSAANTPITAA